MHMEETQADGSNSFVTSVKVQAKRVLLKAKVIIFPPGPDSTVDPLLVHLAHPILFTVGMLHVPWPWGGEHKRFVGACNAHGLIKNNWLQRNRKRAVEVCPLTNHRLE